LLSLRISRTFSKCAVRGAVNAGPCRAPDIGADRVTLSYLGLDDRLRATTLRFEAAARRLSSTLAIIVFDIDPKNQHFPPQ
jgi:hypothetical protein